jgi:hypothetical protein
MMSGGEYGLQESRGTEPSGDHIYGEPFDSAVDAAVGGRSRWSSPREGGLPIHART